MRYKSISALILGLFASCVTPLPQDQITVIQKWTGRIEAVASDLSELSPSEDTRKWAGLIKTHLQEVSQALATGQLQSVGGILDEIVKLKPTIMNSLKEQGVKSEDLLVWSLAFNLAIDGLRDAL